MLIKKNIEVCIDVKDCIGLYTSDDNIIRILADKYEKRCFRGCYIVSVDRVLRRGDCVINQDRDPTFGTIPVIFEVTAVTYAVGEIINGCVVQNKDKTGTIICKTDIANIILKAHPLLMSITRGQFISVRVGHVRYNQASPRVSINAVPMLPPSRVVVYEFAPIPAADLSLLGDVLGRIGEEVEKANKIKKDKPRAWTAFDQMIYAYGAAQTPPESAAVARLTDLPRAAVGGYVSRDPRIRGTEDEYYVYTEPPADAILRKGISPAGVAIALLEDYCAALRTVREMTEIYSEDIIETHKNLWQIFKKAKLDSPK